MSFFRRRNSRIRSYLLLDDVKISPLGTHILYIRKDPNSVMLFDFESKETSTFISEDAFSGRAVIDDLFNFSGDGSFVWSVVQENFVEIVDLFSKEKKYFL